MKDVKKDLEQDKGPEKIVVMKDKMMKVLRKVLIWKAPGPDSNQGYWLKNLTHLHDNLILFTGLSGLCG